MRECWFCGKSINLCNHKIFKEITLTFLNKMTYEPILNSAQRKIDGTLKMDEALENYSSEKEKRAYVEGVKHGIRFMINSYGDLEHCVEVNEHNGLDDSD